VNSNSVYRRGEYFWKELTVTNSSASVWLSITNVAVNGANVTTSIGNQYIPKTSEIYTNDLDGNLTADGRWNYTWDAENRLVKMVAATANGPQQRIDFTYDPMGRRIRKQRWNNTTGTGTAAVDLKFIYEGWNLIGEVDALNSGANVRTYLWGTDLSGSRQGAGGVGGLLAIKNSSGIAQFTVFDSNGNVARLIAGNVGTYSATYEYGPFGETIRASGSYASVNPIRFSTKYSDSETDLLYYGHRYYTPHAGRWLSRDRIEEGDGGNVYHFVHNDSVSHWDFLGAKCCLTTYPAANGYQSHSTLSCDNGAYVSVFPSGAQLGSPPNWHDKPGDDDYYKNRAGSTVCSDCLDESRVASWVGNAKANPDARYGGIDNNCADYSLQALLAGLGNQTKPKCENDCLSRLAGTGNHLIDLFSGTGTGQIVTPGKVEAILKSLNENNCQRFKCIQLELSQHATVF
jgi:RHS repeat-associated protein